LGKNKQALEIIDSLWKNSVQYMKWYCSLSDYRFESSKQDCLMHFYILQQVNGLMQTIDQKKADKQLEELSILGTIFQEKGGDLGY